MITNIHRPATSDWRGNYGLMVTAIYRSATSTGPRQKQKSVTHEQGATRNLVVASPVRGSCELIAGRNVSQVSRHLTDSLIPSPEVRYIMAVRVITLIIGSCKIELAVR